MTEHTFQLVKDALIALPTVMFTGFVAWWAWRRDQERFRVQKILPYAQTTSGEWVLVTQGDIGVLVTNLSLFRIPVCAVGIQLPNGRPMLFADARRESTDKGPLTLPELSSGSDGPKVAWPVDIPSYGRSVFYASLSDWKSIINALGATSLDNPKIKAFAKTQAGTIKYSRQSLKSRVRMYFGRAAHASQQKGQP